MPKWEPCKWEPCKWEPCKWERTRNGCATRSVQIQAETQQEMMSSLQACAAQHQCCNGLQLRTTRCNIKQRVAAWPCLQPLLPQRRLVLCCSLLRVARRQGER
jgi:hypothetical protein